MAPSLQLHMHIHTPYTQICECCTANLPAGLFHLEYPPFQDDPVYEGGITAVRHVVVILRGGLWARECIVSIRVHWETEVEKLHVLTGGPSFPGKPCIPFFPWGPYQTEKTRQSIMSSAPQSVRYNCECLTFSPGSPTSPWGPGKPCRRGVALVFLCMN